MRTCVGCKERAVKSSLLRLIHDAFKQGFEDEAFKAAVKKIGGAEIYYGSAEDIRKETEMGRKIFGEIFKSLGLN